MLTRYPFDVTGRDPGNLVVGERHDLGDIRPQRPFLTREGAFFNESLVIKQGEKTLTLSKDYIFDFFWHDASHETGKAVSCGFRIINKALVGEVQVTYQVVGGKYHTRTEGYKKVLETMPYEPQRVYWEEVLEKPDSWVPTRHMHHVNDVFGLGPLYYAILELGKSLERQSVLKLKAVYDRFLKLKQYVDANLGQNDEFRKQVETTLLLVQEKMDSLPSSEEVTAVADEKINAFRVEINRSLETLREQDTALGERIEEVNTVAQDTRRLMGEEKKTLEDNIHALIEVTRQGLLTEMADLHNRQSDEMLAVSTTIRGEIRAEMERVHQDQNQQNSQLNQLTAMMAESSRDLNQLTTKVNDTLVPFKTQTEQAIADLQTQLQESGGISDAEKQAIEQRFTDILNQINGLNTGDIQTLKTWKETIIDPLTQQLTQSDSRQTEDINRLKEEIQTLQTTLTTVRENLDNQIANSAANTQVEDILQRLTALRQEFDNHLQQNQQEQVGTKTTAENALEKANSNQHRLNQMHDRLNDLNTEIVDLRQASSNLANAADINRDLRELSEKIEELKVTLNFQALSIGDKYSYQDFITFESNYRAELIMISNRFNELENKLKSLSESGVIGRDEFQALRDELAGYRLDLSTVRNEHQAYHSENQTRFDRLEVSQTTQDEEINKLKEAMAKKPDAIKFNDDELRAIVNNLFSERIAQARQANEETPEINTLPINPPGEVDIDYKDETHLKIYPIKTVYYPVEETDRQVFVPTTNIEFTRSGTWTVPDLYDGLTAQVFVTSATKVVTLSDGNLLLTPPSTVMDYILLKGGMNIPITVGTISSFGQYLTNDGLNPVGTLEPTYPIVMPQSQVNRPDENPLSHHGKHGRVRIIV